MVNPGGTGSPIRHISPRFAPFPPSSAFIVPLPSVWRPNRYTYFFAPAPRGATRAVRGAIRAERESFEGCVPRFAAVFRAYVFAMCFVLLRLRNDFRNVGELQDEIPEVRHELQARAPDRGVVRHHHDLVEELRDVG